MHLDKKIWLAETIIIIVISIFSLGKNHSFVFDESNTEVFHDLVKYDAEQKCYTISDAEQTAMIGNHRMAWYPGAYEIEVNYQWKTLDASYQNSCENILGWVQIKSYDNPVNIKYKTIELTDGATVQKDRMWITSLKSLQDVDFKVYYSGNGSLCIKSILVKELMIWRITRILICMAVMLMFNFFISVFTQKSEKKEILLGLLLVSGIASLPAFSDFIIGGHDLPFHLSRILSLAKTLESGRVWDAIEFEMVNGYGYPNPLFYGQLFLYIPAFLYLLALPVHICYQIYVVGVNLLTCLLSYFCFSRITKYKKSAFVGASLYTLSAYRLSNVYVRAAVGEYTAMAFMPLLVLGFWLIYTKDESDLSMGDSIYLVIGLSAIFHSHVLSTEIVVIMIVLLCLLTLRKTFAINRILVLLKTALLTVLVNMGYIVPFLSAMKMDAAVKMQEVKSIQDSGAYLLQVFGLFMTPSGKSLEYIRGDMPICLGFSLFIGMISFLWCLYKRKDWNIGDQEKLKAGKTVALLATISIFFSLSIFPWDSVKLFSQSLAKYVCVIQFPWRYLSVATVFGVLLTVLAIDTLRGNHKEELSKWLAASFVFLTVINAGLFFTQFADISMETQMYASQSAKASIDNIYGGEYLLQGTQKELCTTREVSVNSDLVKVNSFTSNHGIYYLNCDNASEEHAIVEIPVFCYDYYVAYAVDSGENMEVSRGINNRIALSIPEGFKGDIIIEYKIPKLWYFAFIISLVTCIGTGVFYVKNKRKTENS